MVTLVIRTKAAQDVAQPTLLERLARRFFSARMNAVIREIERRPFVRGAWL